jgi:hypothetical protein
MLSKKPIASIPPSKWEPVYLAIEVLANQLISGKRDSFSISFLLPNYKPSPYVQVQLLRDRSFFAEFSSNVYLEPDLKKSQTAHLASMGWAKPNGTNPNYSRSFYSGYPSDSLARYLLSSVRLALDLPLDTWMYFGSSDLDLYVASMSDFWHSLESEGVVCLPGKNPDSTREGVS